MSVLKPGVLKLECVSPLTLFFFIKIVSATLGMVAFLNYLTSLFDYSVLTSSLECKLQKAETTSVL